MLFMMTCLIGQDSVWATVLSRSSAEHCSQRLFCGKCKDLEIEDTIWGPGETLQSCGTHCVGSYIIWIALSKKIARGGYHPSAVLLNQHPSLSSMLVD